GRCELIVSNETQNAVFGWSSGQGRWSALGFGLPAGASLVDGKGNDAGARFVDLDEDGSDDVVGSNDQGSLIALFDSLKSGWSRTVMKVKAGDAGTLPKIVRAGTNNGAWF